MSQEAIRAFAAWTGDDAPIHADEAFARSAGFAGPIAQGLLVASFAERHLSLRPGATAPTAFEVRFRNTVVTNDELRSNWSEDASGRVAFEVSNQRGEVVATGAADAEVRIAGFPQPQEPEATPPPRVWYAEDVLAHFPAGECALPSATREEVQGFETLFVDGRSASKCVPASLLFARGFAAFLRALLECPLPDAGSAGHVGDRWRVQRLPAIGDVIRVRYAAARLERSRSQPAVAIVEFALELDDETGPLIDGAVAIMMAVRPDAPA